MKKSILFFFVLLTVLFSLCFTSCENPLFIEVSKLYTVKFESNGGTTIENYRTSKIESIPTIEKTDATFVGWYTSATFSGNPITLPLDITQDTTLYAKWNQRYTVLFETNGGTEIESYKTDVIRETPQTTKSDCNFIGWYTSGTFAGEKVTFPYILTDSVTLYAKWEPLYNASFATNGGVAISTYKVGTIASIPQTTRVGYRLVSWYLDSNFTNPVSFPYQLDSDTIFYAKWVESNDTVYHVEHYKQDENMSTYILVETENLTGTTSSLTTAVAKIYTGFHANNFEQKNISADGNTKIKVYYDRNSYIVNFKPNGGSGEEYNQTFYYGITQSLTANTFTKSGNTFIGWATSSDGEVMYTNRERIKNITTENGTTIALYAKWFSGAVVTAESISDLDFSTINEEYTVKVTGSISNTTLSALADKIKYASDYVRLDLSETTGLVVINSTSDNTSVFASCPKLKSIILPETLTSIGSYAFKDFTGLASISLPSTVKIIGSNAFNGCTNIETIDLNGLESIGEQAFYGCTGLITANIKNVTAIGNKAFQKCSNLTTVYLENIETIGSYAFGDSSNSNNSGNCKNLEVIYLVNINTIGNYAFAYTVKLASIIIDAKTVGSHAFYGCYTLTSVTLGRNITSLKSYAFGSCSSLASVTFKIIANWYYEMNGRTYKIDISNAANNASNLNLGQVSNDCYKQ